MALTPSNDEAFLREVDDELRREQMTTMWKRYGRIALIAIGLFLLALAVFLWWREDQKSQAEAQAVQLSLALADIQAGRKADADKKLDALVADSKPGYRATALMAKAGLAGDRGDKKTTLALLARVSGDEGLPQAYRDLATIRQTLIDFDDVAPQVVIDRLKPLAVEDSAYFGTAGELSAMALIKMNRGAEAGRLLAAIARNKDMAGSLRARTGQLASMLGTYVDPASLK